MADSLILPARLAAEIINHARQGLPEEVCGLVAGRHENPRSNGFGRPAGSAATEAATMRPVILRAEAVYPGRNISPTPQIAYELDPETLARTIEMADAGLGPVAIYHSHPCDPEAPSETDIVQAAYPDSIYLIVSRVHQDHPTLRGFRIAAGAAREIRLTGVSLT